VQSRQAGAGREERGVDQHSAHAKPAARPDSLPANVEAAANQTGSATDAIAESRCQREVRCNNIGPERTYSIRG
jgi:hypothetical protein